MSVLEGEGSCCDCCLSNSLSLSVVRISARIGRPLKDECNSTLLNHSPLTVVVRY